MPEIKGKVKNAIIKAMKTGLYSDAECCVAYNAGNFKIRHNNTVVHNAVLIYGGADKKQAARTMYRHATR